MGIFFYHSLMDNLFFTLEQLRILVTVVKEGNFKKAASKLYKAQSTISIQIQNLENSLGTQLIHRNKRNIHLTDEGLIVFKYATRILTLCNRVIINVNNLQYREKTLIIGTNVKIYNSFLMKLIKLYNYYFIGFSSIELKNDTLANLFFDLKNGKIDFIFTSNSIPDNFFYDFKKFFFLYDDVVIVSSLDKSNLCSDLKSTDIYNSPIIFLNAIDQNQAFLNDLLEKNNIYLKNLNVVKFLDSYNSLKQAIKKDLGVTLLFLSTLKNNFFDEELNSYKIEPFSIKNKINIIFNPYSSFSNSKKMFIFFLHYIKILNF